MMNRLSSLSLFATLLILAGCASAPVSPAPAAQPAPAPVAAKPAAPTPTASKPVEAVKAEVVKAEPPKPVETPKPVEAAKPASSATAPIVGNWEGKWTIDSMGYEGKTVIVIEKIDGNNVVGKATMFDTPYGDMSEPFSPATFDGNKLNVKHQNATYTLTLVEKDGSLRFSGPMVYVSDNGTYSGNIRVTKK